MKILFLDVDGVLNNNQTSARVETVFGKFTGLNQSLVNKLLDWLRDKDIKIVLSSSWRLDERYDHAFTDTLKQAGITWISETPNEGHRGRDISTWLDNYEQPDEITHWAILDDMSDVSPVGKGLVQTSSDKGLEDKHLRKLEQILEV